MRLRNRTLSGTLLLALVACGGGATGGAPQVVQTADLSKNKLQFSVGSANVPATNANGEQGGPSLNLVETFRQPSGATGLLDSAVSLTGPSKFVVKNIYSNSAIPFDGGAANQVIDLLQPEIAGGEGLAQLVNGVASAPLIGGPPAFPRTTDGNFPAGFSYGIDVFTIGGLRDQGVFPKGFPLGTYTFEVKTPPGSSEADAWTASARLTTTALLPALAAPAISFDGKGGGAISLVVPPKLSEFFVGIAAAGNFCWPQATVTQSTTAQNGSNGLFSFFIRAPEPGPLTLAVPDNLGPPGRAGNAPTFCSAAQNAAADPGFGSGANVTVTLLGADYPLYEMSYPQSTQQLPRIAGSVDPAGKPAQQSDVTISAPATGIAP